MPTVRVPLDGLADVLLRDLTSVKEHVGLEIYKMVAMKGPMLAQQEVANAQPHKPVDRGEYTRSFKTDRLDDGSTVFYNTANYAGVLEKGRRAGAKAPPIAVLTAWVLRKGLAGNKPGRVTGVSKDTQQEAKAIAFAISKKMTKEGWPFQPNQPMRIMEKTVAALGDDILEAVKLGLASALADR